MPMVFESFILIIYSIGDAKSQFGKKVSSFTNMHAHERTLLIFVYSGHTEAYPDGQDTDWMGKHPSVVGGNSRLTR